MGRLPKTDKRVAISVTISMSTLAKAQRFLEEAESDGVRVSLSSVIDELLKDALDEHFAEQAQASHGEQEI